MERELTRADVDIRYTWDLTRIFPDVAAWERAFSQVREEAKACSQRKGTLGGGKEAVLYALREQSEMREKFYGIYEYASLLRSENSADANAQALFSRASSLASEIDAACAFFQPELLAMPQEALQAMIEDPDFADFDALLRGVLRMKPHTLNEREERLMAIASEIRQTPDNAFSMLSQADLDLGYTRGEDGKRVHLTDARFPGLLASTDRAVRRSAYFKMMDGYARMGHTIAALYAGQVKSDLFESQVRGFSSARQAALYPNDIGESVYDNLIEAVHGGIGTLSEYLRLKKERLKVARLHLYDLYADVKDSFNVHMDIDEAFATFLDVVAPLGEDYQRDAARALPERWIDVYETKAKTSGAFCTGSVYWTTPYVLLNHQGDYDSLSALCHEMGHAMHSFYSLKAQPFPKAYYTIFVAEVASTFNEVLLFEYMRKKHADDRKAQISLIGSMLESFRTTVFRQTMFAEFEHQAHVLAQEGEALTRERLCAVYLELNKRYYGGTCVVDEAVQSEWMRIPHFYMPYYVYQYATGFCAAVTLAKGVLSGDVEKVSAYRRFLTLGGSMPPLEELRVAGVDMSTPEPVCQALDYFAELLLLYRELLDEEA